MSEQEVVENQSVGTTVNVYALWLLRGLAGIVCLSTIVGIFLNFIVITSNSSPPNINALLIWHGGGGALILALAWLAYPEWVKFPGWKKLAKSLPLGASFIATLYAFSWAYQAAYPANEEWSTEYIKNPLSLFISLVCAPVFEEILYRGVYFRWVQKYAARLGHKGALIAAILSTSLLFGFSHVQHPLSDQLVLIGLGIVLAYMRYKTNTLWVPIVLHSFASICAFTVILLLA